MELILIRHGETDWNVAGRIQGHLDLPLNATGVAQAQALAERFRGEAFDVIYSSDLDRAYRTAEAVAGSHRAIIKRDTRLRERHLGVLQGLTRDEALVQHPAAWALFKSRTPDAELEGGESLRVFCNRVSDLLRELCERHPGKRVALVTHGGVLDAAYRHAMQMPLDTPRHFPIQNVSVSVLLHLNGQWQIARWGDVSHLKVGTAGEEHFA